MRKAIFAVVGALLLVSVSAPADARWGTSGIGPDYTSGGSSRGPAPRTVKQKCARQVGGKYFADQDTWHTTTARTRHSGTASRAASARRSRAQATKHRPQYPTSRKGG
jgi:hypothetical protein